MTKNRNLHKATQARQKVLKPAEQPSPGKAVASPQAKMLSLPEVPRAASTDWAQRLMAGLGTTSNEFLAVEVANLICALRDHGAEDSSMKLHAAVALIESIKPSNELEATLAVQLAAAHALVMKLMGRANDAVHDLQLENSGSMAIRLMRAYAGQVEALARLRENRSIVPVEQVTDQSRMNALPDKTLGRRRK